MGKQAMLDPLSHFHADKNWQGPLCILSGQKIGQPTRQMEEEKFNLFCLTKQHLSTKTKPYVTVPAPNVCNIVISQNSPAAWLQQSPLRYTIALGTWSTRNDLLLMAAGTWFKLSSAHVVRSKLLKWNTPLCTGIGEVFTPTGVACCMHHCHLVGTNMIDQIVLITPVGERTGLQWEWIGWAHTG